MNNYDTWARQLFEASCCGRVDAVRYILSRTQLLAATARDRDGNTPLIWAAFNGHADVVRELLPRCGDPNYSPNDDGQTALMSAAWNGDEDGTAECIDALIDDQRVDINRRNRFGRNAAYYAVVTGRKDIVGKLLALPVPADFSLVPGADANLDHMRRMRLDPGTVSFLESRLAELGKSVHPAWWRDTGDADPAIDASAALRFACLDPLPDLAEVQRAIDNGADPNGRSIHGITPLMCAAWTGRADAVKLLLSISGIDVLARDNLGRTAFYYAMAANLSITAKIMGKRAPELVDIPDFANRKPINANIEEMDRCHIKIPEEVRREISKSKKRAAEAGGEPAQKRVASADAHQAAADNDELEAGPSERRETDDSQSVISDDPAVDAELDLPLSPPATEPDDRLVSPADPVPQAPLFPPNDEPDIPPVPVKPEAADEHLAPHPTWSQHDELSRSLATEARLRSEAEELVGLLTSAVARLSDEKEGLQCRVGELDTANQELSTANAELVTANAELVMAKAGLAAANAQLTTRVAELKSLLKSIVDRV